MHLPPLNLPPYPFRLKMKEGKLYIYDELRRKFLLCTPEEWVRQHVVQFLCSKKSYPKSMLQLEGGLQLNTLAKRHDILAYDLKGNKHLLAECKAPGIKLTQDVIDQAARYNHVHKAPWMMLSNGIEHLFYAINFAKMSYLRVDELPDFTR